MMVVVLVVGACTGSAPANIDSGRACNGQLYDSCLQEHECASMDCRPFLSDGFQVCSKSCIAGDNASCGTTLDGRTAMCDATGHCKPPGPNDCVIR